jgi:hypothetical protein
MAAVMKQLRAANTCSEAPAASVFQSSPRNLGGNSAAGAGEQAEPCTLV